MAPPKNITSVIGFILDSVHHLSIAPKHAYLYISLKCEMHDGWTVFPSSGSVELLSKFCIKQHNAE